MVASSAATDATNAAVAKPPADHVTQRPRAHKVCRQSKRLCYSSSHTRLRSQEISWPRTLTVKLNGRAEAPDWRRGRTISSSARGAQPPAHHGPFQRWLEDAPTSLLCARGIFSANQNWPTQRTPIAQRRHSRDKAQPPAPALPGGLSGCPRARKRKRSAKGLGLCASNPISPSRRILAASSNGEAERPHAGARSEPRAHTHFPRPRRHYRASRPAPAIVRPPR